MPEPPVAVVPFAPQFLADREALIAALPEWFGIPESNAAYLASLARLPSWVALCDGRVVGAVTLEQHFASSFEVHFIAVRPELHRRGVGRTLVRHVAAEARARGGRWLHVKTLAPSDPDPNYARTRAFYEAMGFGPLFESPALWGPENPAVVLVRPL
jgi:ribosomal protein S18 acetylase RimI-like enzyme